ncbi:MAG: hypothetical protein E7249_02100 [Paenibacillaceae bacterium]|nr:hypothetical protein [Paenibacillaceae bacterium]
MELITDFEKLSKAILKKYEGNSITMGIQVADYRQSEAREYMLNYLNHLIHLIQLIMGRVV